MRGLLWAALWGLLFPCGAFALECPPLPLPLVRELEAPAQPPQGIPGDPLGGVTPHHDLAAGMILRFYRALAAANPSPRRVILLSPDHFRGGPGPVTLCGEAWNTPFGPLRGDREGAELLLRSGLALRRDGLFPREHGVTIHLPLIRLFFPDASVLLLVLRDHASDLQLLGLRQLLLSHLEEGDLVLLSMDLSHHKLPAQAEEEDRRTLPALERMASGSLKGLDLDCPRGAALFLGLMRERGAARGILGERTHSGNLNGDLRVPCTTYATLFYPREP